MSVLLQFGSITFDTLVPLVTYDGLITATGQIRNVSQAPISGTIVGQAKDRRAFTVAGPSIIPFTISAGATFQFGFGIGDVNLFDQYTLEMFVLNTLGEPLATDVSTIIKYQRFTIQTPNFGTTAPVPGDYISTNQSQTSVTVMAIPVVGYKFKNWDVQYIDDDAFSPITTPTQNPLTLAWNHDATNVLAIFEIAPPDEAPQYMPIILGLLGVGGFIGGLILLRRRR